MAEAPPSVGSAASCSASTPQWIGLPCVPELNIRKTKRVLLFRKRCHWRSRPNFEIDPT